MILKHKSIYFASVLALGISAVSLNSCSGYLDTEPITDQIVVETAPIRDAADAEEKMTSIYSEFGGEYWQLDQFMNGDSQTDVAYAGADNVQNFQQDEYRILSTNSNVNRDWNYLYVFIFKCNIILNNIDSVADVSPARKTEMKAEASILRALAYFHAVQLWGDVPLVTKAVTSVNAANFDEVYAQTFPTRKPVTEAYTMIISDLEGAIAAAPANSQKYRANKGAAYALLAKVNATKPSPDWAKVKQYCDLVTGYSLLPVYDQLFDGNHEANAESIWEADGNSGNIWAWGSSMFYGTDWKKFNTPSNDLVKTFTDAADTQRLNASVWFSSTTVSWSDSFWPSNHFPFAYKMRKTDGTQNFYLLRYADILLLKAEANVRTGDLNGAESLVNQVRARVSLSPITIASADDGINKILSERKMELAFEGHRWFDLKRTGKAIAILSQQKNGNGVVLPYASSLNQNRLLWPIPQAQMDKNANLVQNPGY
ncbi:RagB/SusD family nutrient uptake outer membrane protein [Chryseobacterium sp.]|uniref:RagB/SusD family nutrient uptake outer membrane protein n=1 Tax=Chryseobacterium sp. TaxID=1871047 RepID=UPI0011C8EA54|nr:RagB/SusD family nutrient uptake outer membrane protein [Chryseobacterium sp.]TXF79292.1 RagB/SusD family nutrient uptake outer membrane protein [Chryseobacterium sp.]